MTALITKTYTAGGVATPFTFRDDGWFNMTKAAKAFGKDLSNFLRSPETQDYLDALLSVKSTEKELVSVKRGGGHLGGVGTWAHPKLATFFARWLDVRFSVWCDAMIADILTGKADVVITKPETSAVMQMPSHAASLEGWAAELRRADTLAARVAQLEPQAKIAQIVCNEDESLESFLRGLTGVNLHAVFLDLESLGYIYRRGNQWRARRGRNEVREGHVANSATVTLVLTRVGKLQLIALYQNNRLTMKLGQRPSTATAARLAHSL